MTRLAAALLLGLTAPAASAPAVAWVELPAGEFVMGRGASADWRWARPPRRVKVAAFRLAQAPATFAQYRACVDAGACTPAHLDDGACFVPRPDGSWGRGVLPAAFRGDDHPAVCLDWDQARAFCVWAGGRLPSEAEWEYAARSGGRERLYPWGDEPPTCARAVIPDAAGPGCGRGSTWPVCSKRAGDTDQGLCDMSGNAWTWTADSFHKSYRGAPADGRPWGDPGRRGVRARGFAANPDGSAWGATTDANPVGRGGSWRVAPGFDRVAFRFPLVPTYPYSTGGVRPARDAD
ncbi:MAG: SUMF1/EgtB/PvdO family nonheme iron enzyme [Elusimicrobiota bacterium]|nr:SUMF1/EgtB/PvdO family nonheme iron enzyme [Elusimicrobiota bacterium]